MKKCSKCEVLKEETEFWVRKNRPSGTTSECKSCASERRRSRDKEKVNQKHREWCERNREKTRESSTRYQKENKDKVNEAHAKWYEKNKEKIAEQRIDYRDRHNKWARTYTKKEEVKFKKRANGLLNYHVKNGNIKKHDKCQICCKEGKTEGHHADYDKPLEVVWVCKKCHTMIHKNLKKGD